MTATGNSGRGKLFISYAGRDRAWAEWVTWQLRDAGYTTEFDSWDWDVGDNAVLRMSDALERADQVVALFSEAYFERERFTTDEWTAVMAMHGRLVPLKIEPVTPSAVLRPIIFRELHGLGSEQARRVLLEAVDGVRGPDRPPAYPGEHATLTPDPMSLRLPGVLPGVWNVPARDSAFTGRDGMLLGLRDRLCAGGPVVVQALYGMGGVGKTSLAVEYAHRFANGYQLVWWVDAERPGLIGEQLAALAVAAGWVPAGTEAPSAVAETQRRLRTGTGWLVVFDNAEQPPDLQPWLPQGAGHVLITSRNPAWRHTATPVGVDVFARGESVMLLRRLAPTLTEEECDQLAAALGDLPLAVAQAGGVLAETGIPVPEYRQALAAQTIEVLAEGSPPGYRVPLTAAVRVSVDKLAGEDQAAVALLRLCAFLAPEPIPAELFTTSPDGTLPEPLATVAGSQWALRRTLGRIGRYGLATIDNHGLRLHRLTQAILRNQLTPDQRADQRNRVAAMLAAGQPDIDAANPRLWPNWAALLPHLLAVDPVTIDSPALRHLSCTLLWYLLRRAEYRTVFALAERWREHWSVALGPDDEHTLWATSNLATAHARLGDYERARQLDEDTYARRRRVLGDHHPQTLRSATNLVIDLRELGEHEAALHLNEDSYTRCQRALGDDHPVTLRSITTLAIQHARLGDYQRARQLDEDTFMRRRKLLGADHPDTLRSAGSLAADLSALGHHERARDLYQDTLNRYRRIFRDDHPHILESAANLAATLRILGEEAEADRLTREFGRL